MKVMSRSMVVLGLATIISISSLLPAFASTAGRKNTAIALTAATVATAFKKHKTAAVVLGLGSAQAWKNYEDSRKRDSRERQYRYRYQRAHKHHHHDNGVRNAWGRRHHR